MATGGSRYSGENSTLLESWARTILQEWTYSVMKQKYRQSCCYQTVEGRETILGRLWYNQHEDLR